MRASCHSMPDGGKNMFPSRHNHFKLLQFLECVQWDCHTIALHLKRSVPRKYVTGGSYAIEALTWNKTDSVIEVAAQQILRL